MPKGKPGREQQLQKQLQAADFLSAEEAKLRAALAAIHDQQRDNDAAKLETHYKIIGEKLHTAGLVPIGQYDAVIATYRLGQRIAALMQDAGVDEADGVEVFEAIIREHHVPANDPVGARA